MKSDNITNLLLTVCITLAFIVIFFNPLKQILKMILNGILGGFLIYLSNTVFLSLGFNVGLNIITLSVSTFLGLPGTIALFIIQSIL